jgi:hypothetical protein
MRFAFAVRNRSSDMRAHRFPLQLAVSYRAVGQIEWQTARTANVSASGVLVQAADLPAVNTSLEFRLALRPEAGSNPSSHVSGRGHVVRQIQTPQFLPAGFAVAFDEYDISPVNELAPA